MALFTGGAVFCSHEPADIARAVLAAYERRDELMSQIPPWVARHETSVREQATSIRAAVGLTRAP
jgi:hypothetical protein